MKLTVFLLTAVLGLQMAFALNLVKPTPDRTQTFRVVSTPDTLGFYTAKNDFRVSLIANEYGSCYMEVHSHLVYPGKRLYHQNFEKKECVAIKAELMQVRQNKAVDVVYDYYEQKFVSVTARNK